MQGQASKAIFDRARKVMPRGVTSNFRYWGDESTNIAKRAQGAYLWDADGNRYIDYRLGFGPVILGHAHEAVDAHVIQAIQDGQVYAMTTEREVRVAERVTTMCPAVEVVRYATSGAEATMHALRVARAYAGRDKIIKFEGQYHGMYDYALWSTYAPVEALGSRRSPIPVAASSGIPRVIGDLIITLPFNDFELLEETFKRHWHELACIIVEPILGNCASIEPQPGFLDFIRNLCDQYSVVFILDEVKTGFRLAPGGAQELYQVRPDLATYAKSMGNGYPIAMFGGKREIMNVIGNGVAHGGTYTGNTVAIAAAEKVLEMLANGTVLKRVAELGRMLQEGLSEILDRSGLPYVFSGHPSMFGLLFTDHQPKDYRDWAASDHEGYEKIMQAMIERGVMPDPDSREPWFISAAHNEQDIADTLTAFEGALHEVLA
jgi:glutamate-1-semialdehyde 2,1-aminomutase